MQGTIPTSNLLHPVDRLPKKQQKQSVTWLGIAITPSGTRKLGVRKALEEAPLSDYEYQFDSDNRFFR